MSYSYSAPNTYVQYEPAVYQPDYYKASAKKKHPSLNAGLAGAAVGLAGGTVIALRKNNPYMPNGVPTDDFVKTAFDNYLKTAPDAKKAVYNQCNEILNGLNNVKNAEELKALLNKNAEGAKVLNQMLDAPLENYLKSVTDSNIASNKEVIKKTFDNANEIKLQNMKNKIEQAWNAEKKAFVKPDNMEEDVFNAIKNVTGKARRKFVIKYAAIAAAIAGVVTFGVHKILTVLKNRQQ